MLVADVTSSGWSKVEEFKNPARLAEGGINDRIILPEAMTRGVNAVSRLKASATELGCEKILAFATAAVRSAKNQSDFLNQVKDTCGITIDVIDGDREAALIANGIMSSGAVTDASLIMDIGGGSTEFILIDEEKKVVWKKSYPLGVTLILDKFQPQDPITTADRVSIRQEFEKALPELIENIKKYNPQTLVGSSGSFNSLAAMACHMMRLEVDDRFNRIIMHQYHTLADQLITLERSERLKIPGLAPHRVDTLPMGILLMDYVINRSNITGIKQSAYALKEGVMEELVQTC